jgi:hypothetical protein
MATQAQIAKSTEAERTLNFPLGLLDVAGNAVEKQLI